MIKRIFSWFFCNLYYFYAKKKSKDNDFVIVGYIGVLMAFPVMYLAYGIVWALSDFQYNKGVAMMTLTGVIIPFLILFNRLFYKNKRYLTLLEKFPEENYNKYIFYYSILFLFILPGGVVITIGKLFS